MLWLFRSILVTLVYTGLVIYTGFRVFAFGRLLRPGLKRLVFWPLYVLLSYNFIFLVFFRLDRIQILYLLGMYWIPFFVYIFGFILLFDISAFILFIFRKIRKKPGTIRLMPAGAGAAMILALVILVYGSFHAWNIQTVRYELSIPEKPGTENFRIVLVSDLHIGPTVGKDWTARIVDRVNNASPDMVCMAGDIFDSGLEGISDSEGIAAELARINAPLGVYACLGNHDTDRRIHSTEAIARFLSKTGIIPLRDEVRLSKKSGVYVAGRKDARPIGVQAGRLSIEELAASIAETVQDGGGAVEAGTEPVKPLVILLDHQPVDLPREADAGIDLILCGHSHKGQFFPGNLFTYKIFKGYGGTDYGLWQKGKTWAVVSSGAGVWGPPVRIATRSEIVVLDLRF